MDKGGNNPRDERFHNVSIVHDVRSPSERDCDRILYSTAFRRLSGVTQIVNPAEIKIFHNRLTHSLKVAQIAKRIALSLLRKDVSKHLLKTLDPNVVEAAALAHDLGHPPFGHTSEKALDKIIRSKIKDAKEGYEGNAQSFRIVNKLSIAYIHCRGLNLTRATLNAILKYPWLPDSPISEKHDNKYGAYFSEEEEFHFARNNEVDGKRYLEATIMDLADDITYAVHDLEDLYKAGFIPQKPIGESIPLEALTSIVENSNDDWLDTSLRTSASIKKISRSIHDFLNIIPFGDAPFDGSARSRIMIRSLSSVFISTFLASISLVEKKGEYPSIKLKGDIGYLILALKKIPEICIYNKPALLRIQFAQERIIKSLFDIFYESIEDGKKQNILPGSILHLYLKEKDMDETKRVRFVSDAVSSLSDEEAIHLHAKLCGITISSIFENEVY